MKTERSIIEKPSTDVSSKTPISEPIKMLFTPDESPVND